MSSNSLWNQTSCVLPTPVRRKKQLLSENVQLGAISFHFKINKNEKNDIRQIFDDRNNLRCLRV